jgi:hypothetical protein
VPRYRFVAVLAVAVLSLSGCELGTWWNGNKVAKRPAGEILAEARANALAAGSVHVRGQMMAKGQPVSIDMRVVQDQAATGEIRMGPHTVELVRSAGTVYVKGSDGFYRSLGITAMPDQLRGKYLQVQSTDREFASLAQFTDMKRIFDVFLGTTGQLTKGRQEEVHGLRALPLEERGGVQRVVFVALSEQPLPLRVSTRPGSPENGSVDFTEYGQPFTVRPPAATMVIDVDRLANRAGG